MVTAVESDDAMSVRRLINQWCNIRTTWVVTLMVTAVESDDAMSVRRLINQWCNIRTTQVGTLMVTAVESDDAMSVRRLTGISLSFGVAGRHCHEPGRFHCFIV